MLKVSKKSISNKNYYKLDSIWVEPMLENVWVKFLRSLKTLNFGTAGDIEQHVLRRTHNVPIAKSVKKVLFYMVQAT